MICPNCGETRTTGLCYSTLCRALRAADQEDIDAANRQLDPADGIVAGDGYYYPRLNPDGTDPFDP